jgi:hypothetical protein
MPHDYGFKPRGRWRVRLAAVLAAIAMTVAGVGVAAAPAYADDSSEYPNCQNFQPAGVGTSYGGGFGTPSVGDWYAYGPTISTVSWSACEDITIYWQYLDDWTWRVRFYPSSGGSYVNAWKVAPCPNYCSVVIATNVANGTRFRIEGHQSGAGGQQTTYSRPFDVYL